MVIKSAVSRAAAAVLAFVLLLSLAGCADSKKMQAYNTGIVAAGTALNEASAKFNTAVGNFKAAYSDENRDALIAAVKELDAAYQQLGSLEAPDKYAEVQALYRESAELFSEAAANYEEQLGKVASSADITEEFVQKLQEGDELLNQAKEKMMEGSKRGQEINEGK